MLKKWMEAWGYYALALLCAAVIVFSALWTKKASPDTPDTQALSDESQHLADVTPRPTAPPLARPVPGDILQPFSLEMVYFPEVRLWHTHPAVDFSVSEGEEVRAVVSGTVDWNGSELILDQGNGVRARYRGLSRVTVRTGQTVRAGETIGVAGAAVPFEGGNRVCVSLERDGRAVPLENGIDNP